MHRRKLLESLGAGSVADLEVAAASGSPSMDGSTHLEASVIGGRDFAGWEAEPLGGLVPEPSGLGVERSSTTTLFDEIIDESVGLVVHMVSFEFRLTRGGHSRGVVDTVNAGLFVWDGAKTRLDRGIALRWTVSERTGVPGTIEVFETSESAPARWTRVADMPVDHGWHLAVLTVDVRNGVGAAAIDDTKVPTPFAMTARGSEWPFVTAGRLQLEATHPSSMNCAGALDVRNWTWAQMPYAEPIPGHAPMTGVP